MRRSDLDLNHGRAHATVSHFSAFERHAELTAVHRNSSDLNLLDYHVWAPCWKSTINSSQSLRWLVESRPADHLGRAATRTHQRGGGELHPSFWLPTRLWLPMVVTPSICSNSVQVPSLHPRLITNKLALFRVTTTADYRWRQRSERWEMGVSWLKQHNFVILRYLSTKLGGNSVCFIA